MMSETLRRFLRLAVGYGLATLAGPLINVLLTPLYTRLLEPSDYGVVDVTTTLVGILAIVASLGMDQALTSIYFANDEADRRKLIGSAVILVFAVGGLIALLLNLFARPLALLLFGEPGRQVTIHAATVSLVFGPIYTFCSVALKFRMGVRRVNALALVYALVLVVANICLVLFFQLKATGIVAAYAIANCVGAIVGILLIRGPLMGQWSPRHARLMARAGVVLFPLGLGLMALNNLDRLILTQFVAARELGIYAVANKLALIVTLITSTAIGAWMPLALSIARQPEAPQLFARMYEHLLAGSCMAALAIGLFTGEIVSLFARDAYLPASGYATALMAYTGPILTSAAVFSIGLHASGAASKLGFAYFATVLTNILTNLFFLPSLGLWGAVLATICAGLVLSVCTYVSSQRVYNVRYRWLRTSTVMAGYSVILLVHIALAGVHGGSLVWRATCLIAMLLVLIACDVARPEKVIALVQSTLLSKRN